MSKYKICPVCGAKNEPTVFECVECEADLTGEKVQDDEIEVQDEKSGPRVELSKELVRVCSECGQVNPPNARKCEKCGEDISDVVPTPKLDERPKDSNIYVLASLDGQYTFKVPDGETVIGRTSAMNEYLGPRMFVSRTHAKLISLEGALYIENLSGTNYTFVNNQKIPSRTKLEDGDEIGLGGVCIDGKRQDGAAYFLARSQA